jgi:hypothetical protein
MWTSIVVKMVTSEMAKMLIAMLVKKLLDHSKDGVTKEVASTLIDGIVMSKANNVTENDVVNIRAIL